MKSPRASRLTFDHIARLIRSIDDCFSINGAAVNLRMLAKQQPVLRAVRRKIDLAEKSTRK